MSAGKLRIVFLGNPEFARYHLEKIVDAGHHVVAVISAPDKPAGRGMSMRATPVTEYARSLNLPCLQPKNLKNKDFQDDLASYEADIQVVIAFRMLPVAVWDMPRLGTYNLHASLLPQYRGAAPINWAIMNGETETGVSTFKLKHEIDTGNLIEQRTCTITPEDTAGSLHDKLMHLGAEAMLSTIEKLESGRYEEIPQKEVAEMKSAPKLYAETCEVDWTRTGVDILNFIRGLNPFPTATCSIHNKKVKLYGARFLAYDVDDVGHVYTDGKTYLGVSCSDGIIMLDDVKMEGKKRMQIAALLNGLRMEASGELLV